MYENVLIKPGQHTLSHTHTLTTARLLSIAALARALHTRPFSSMAYFLISVALAQRLCDMRARGQQVALSQKRR